MIANIVKGNGFRGALDYNLAEKKDAEILDKNMIGENARDLAKEFSVSRQKNPKLKNPVFHTSLSFHESDKLDNEKMKEITRDYMKEMGFSNTQYVVIKHNDTKHQHLHIVASRIDENGKSIKDGNDRRNSVKIERKLEKKYGLYEVKKLENGKSKNYDKKENEFQNRTGAKFQKEEIRNSIKEYFENRNSEKTLSGFVDKLNQDGIKVKFNTAKTGHISGVSFKSDKFTFKGSAINKEMSWKKLSSELNFNENKDKSTVQFSNYLSGLNENAKDFAATNKFYKHLVERENIKPESFNFEKSFAVLNKINHDKLKPVYDKWDSGDFTNEPKEILTKVAKQIEEKERNGFYQKVNSVNENLSGFFNENDKKEIFNSYLSNKISEKDLNSTIGAIQANSQFLPKDLKEGMGITGKEYFEHKLSTFQSHDFRKSENSKEFSEILGKEKLRLENNVKVYGENNSIDVKTDLKQIKYLKFNKFELEKLSLLNDRMENGESKFTPLDYIKKQAEVTKTGNHEKGIAKTPVYNKEFKERENHEKARLKYNLHVFGQNTGFDVSDSIKKVDKLKFNDLELQKLTEANNWYDKKDWGNNPLILVDKQESFNKLDKFEMVINTTQKLNKEHEMNISKDDVKHLLGKVKETDFSYRVPALVNDFSKKIEKGEFSKGASIVKYVDDNLKEKNKKESISTPSFFQDLNKASQIAQESSGGRRVKRRTEEEEKEQKQDRGMEIS